MSQPVLIIGAGGHGKVCADVSALQGHIVVGFFDNNAALLGHEIEGVRILGGDPELNHYPPHEFVLINGIGSITSLQPRRSIYERMTDQGYQFIGLCHPHAVVARSASLDQGVQIMAGAIIQPGARIGENCIINSSTTIEHDSTIGAHSHIAPGAVVCGGVRIGMACHIGAGATLLQGITIGNDAFVAAGAVVVNDVKTGQRVAGVPAREMKTK